MKNIEALIQQISSLSNCRINRPNGIPVTESYNLPADLKRFYELCGGMILFDNKDYSIHIVSPEEFISSNPVIVGEQVEEDISSHWFIIAHDGNGDYLSIDLHPKRVGKCYDSFWDRHGVVGDCPVVARSFNELLNDLVQNNGERWYWLKEDFESLGDAYDIIDDELFILIE
ncbi:SMI1/KNR4 family protein [Paenibacillus radicis (ex Gao et al. 2016)]|uniref:SMI1/KNR4 family protein n=1 Tax=Paenibacillus radicis (ex Gao et al. 2016) TaxID=1737354 RepID=A0A917M038_9BACL|nr:SMI1/KNR4 family protein [Paenibacillus radicis (ex Gao et al. 2016)]GGG70428.1 SMI1/KNR4 family protein [Paenibacillus radicis (ex Gao et al. 2016)]